MRWYRIVDPAFEMDLAQADDDRARLAGAPWLQPWAVSPDLELRLATSCTVVRTDADGVVLIDPFCTFGGASDVERRVGLLADAGVAVDDVTHVVLTHVDGLGACVDGDGAPVFTSARLLAPGDDLRAIASGDWPDLGPLARFGEPHDGSGVVVPGVALVPLPGHQPGHAGVAVGDPWEVLCTGHLFVDPAQVADLDRPGLDEDLPTASATRRTVLARAADEGFALIGPLWPSPGVAYVTRSGEGFTLRVPDPEG
jgi:glyoxylase-like metal-dependent hydrolase (beta-lactamase superfamily II)